MVKSVCPHCGIRLKVILSDIPPKGKDRILMKKVYDKYNSGITYSEICNELKLKQKEARRLYANQKYYEKKEVNKIGM